MTGALAKKLAEVMAEVDRIPKRGRNDFHKYDYATEADIAEAIRGALAKRAVMLLPEITDWKREPVGEKGSVLTSIVMNFTFIDGETGESITRMWAGAGTDKEDKGLYKAMTGGEKYFLLKTFLMPTGDDPEGDEKKKADKPRVEVSAPVVHQTQVPEGAFRLQKVEQHETSAAKMYFLIVTDECESLMTWSESVGKAAEQACQLGQPVRLQIRGKYEDMGVIKSLTVAAPYTSADDALKDIAQVFNKTVPPGERAF